MKGVEGGEGDLQDPKKNKTPVTVTLGFLPIRREEQEQEGIEVKDKERERQR